MLTGLPCLYLFAKLPAAKCPLSDSCPLPAYLFVAVCPIHAKSVYKLHVCTVKRSSRMVAAQSSAGSRAVYYICCCELSKAELFWKVLMCIFLISVDSQYHVIIVILHEWSGGAPLSKNIFLRHCQMGKNIHRVILFERVILFKNP